MKTRRSILIVDDDDDLRTMLCAVLAGEGYDVVTASDGAEALDRLHHQDLPSMLIVDLMMPRMDGESLIRRMLEEPTLATLPVTVMSGFGEACAANWPPPVTACLVKPVELDELLTAVARDMDGNHKPS